jgi:integrase
MALRIKDYKSKDGSRFSLLIDTEDGGLPLYYPTAYTSMQLSSLSANTQRVSLYCLKRVYDWASERKIDLDHRFATKKLLTVPEVESLVQALRTNAKEDDGTSIKGAKSNYYLDIVGNYFGWLFGHWITDSNAEENRLIIESLQAKLASRKSNSGSKSRDRRRRIAKKLSDAADKALLELFASFELPPSPQGSLFQYGVAYRNVLALRILYDLGIRIGELLSLKYSDFIPASGGDHAQIRIERNHDDAFDRRMNQPVAKTLGRTLPISAQLEQMMFTYLGTYRADVPNVGYDDGSFIFVNHKRGENQGREIEMSTFRSALAVIIKRDKRLKGLHPHLLRHHWNYRFSEESEKRGLSDTKTRQDREHWMGWVEGSQSAKDYDLRHIQKSANEHGRAIASDTARDIVARKRSGSSRYGAEPPVSPDKT